MQVELLPNPPRTCAAHGSCVALRCVALLIALLALGLAQMAAAATTQVQSLKLLQRDGHIAAVFQLSSKSDYRLFQLKHPARVVLDFSDTHLASRFAMPDGAGAVLDVRSGRRAHHGLRFVLDMRGDVQSRTFLKSLDGNGYRLTVDLYPPHATAKARAKPPAKPARPVVIVIDPGHGGKDPGSIGPDGTYEKTITLAVSRKLAAAINQQPGMKAYLTRNDDRFIPLKQRYAIARKDNADLFISVHADSYTSSDAKGSSVWVLSTHGKTSEAARWLANRENRADLVGGVSLDDKPSTLAAVLLDLSQSATMQISQRVARNVLQALAQVGPTHRGHIEHANFVVLRSPDVPSILVETAFISNPVEERKLENPHHQQVLAKAIVHGVKHYFEKAPPPGTWFAAHRPVPSATHTVVRGDTLSAIAQEYGVSLGSLRKANNLSDANDLQTGSVLHIPTG